MVRDLLITIALLSGTPVRAQDQWSVNEVSLPSSQRVADNVRKWCENGGTKVRFSNTSVSGYHECGELATTASCDAAGKKYIGPAAQAPYSYRDCQMGPRIYLKRHDEPLEGVYDAPVATVPAPPPPVEVGATLSTQGNKANAGILNPTDLSQVLKLLTDHPELRETLKDPRRSPRH